MDTLQSRESGVQTELDMPPALEESVTNEGVALQAIATGDLSTDGELFFLNRTES
jgi:hypothetical protein